MYISEVKSGCWKSKVSSEPTVPYWSLKCVAGRKKNEAEKADTTSSLRAMYVFY